MDIVIVSCIKNASVSSNNRTPSEEFISDYYVGFGRRFNGVPIIGSKLVLRIDGDGDVAMVNKTWRQIERVTGNKSLVGQKTVVSSKSLPELMIRDSSLQ